jgi:hypothetical protein
VSKSSLNGPVTSIVVKVYNFANNINVAENLLRLAGILEFIDQSEYEVQGGSNMTGTICV